MKFAVRHDAEICGYFSDLNEIGLSLNKIVKAKIIVRAFIFIHLIMYCY